MSRSESDGGSATIWVIGACAVLGALTVSELVVGSAVVARHRTEAAADVAALAGAAQIGLGADPCSAAQKTSLANGAQLLSCRLTLSADGRSGSITVALQRRVELLGFGRRPVTAVAKAGRLPA